MILVSWIGWKLTKEKTELISRMMNYFFKSMEQEDYTLVQTVSADIVDAASYENPGEGANYVFVFGKTAQGNLSGSARVFYLQDLDKLLPTKENAQNRSAAMVDISAAIKEIVSSQQNQREEQAEKVVAAVVADMDATIGVKETDLIITPNEANYLLQIKSLLGGHFKKIRLTKGDIVIEVEE